MAQPKPTRAVVGVDTHGDVHVACAIDELGRHLATAQFPTTPKGYRTLLGWARGLGPGGGLRRGRDRLLRRRPGPFPERAGVGGVRGQPPRPAGAAPAWYVRSGGCRGGGPGGVGRSGDGHPKSGDQLVEMVRCLRVARATAVKSRSQAANALGALLVAAPAELRERLRGLPADRLARAAARLRPGPTMTPPRRPSWRCGCWASATRPWLLSSRTWTPSWTG